ncbi:MAG: hypothetical protein AB8B50_14535 [Pirellulaceae bacterium]
MANARGKLYVDKKVQGALASRIVFHWFVFFILSLVSLYTLEYFMGDPALTMGERLSVLWSRYASFVLLMICIIPAFIYDSMKLSNRFAGPMVRLKDSISRLADGEPTPELNFRDGDFWKDVSTEFNRMVEKVKPQESK